MGIEEHLEGDIPSQADAWRDVYQTCVKVGMLGFIGNSPTGRGRVCEFIEYLARRVRQLEALKRAQHSANLPHRGD